MTEPTPAARPTQVLSISPIVLPVPGRAVDLQLRVTAPVTGGELPILLLSHGHGPSNHLSSLNGYAPLAHSFAAHGFVVIQPTHLDSKTLPFRSSDHPDAPLFWRSRAEDMKQILDQLDAIERAAPALAGRVDRSKVAVLGHSMGGHTASVLLGARLRDPRDGSEVSLAEPRIRAGVLLAAPGRGDALSKYAAEHYPFFSTIDFSTMTTPALVVAGDKDGSPHLTTAGAAWHADPYVLAPGPKSLLTLFDAGHGLGGVSGYDAAETTDENPARVAAVQRLSAAYLRTQLYPGDPAWQAAQHAFTRAADPLGRIESK
ncbi:chlorophyllase [Nannocystis sp. ILAH1]|uniref:alpha/beta hydrolase family protein n=1 Tax=unclassified Nannocystis TaxID=2627009 RepID=UPI002270F583|nr:MULTISPECIES: chlorophyllase [unclassified Nannocystis]MCY0993461.1 chlorophyllase [Nannocystis sp. ILAH1]MCY1063811.1 chlorophyllase [Nannocystis sp. RBIL2]